MSAIHLYRHMPGAYSRQAASGNSHLLSALDVGLATLRTAITDLKADTAISTANGDGLSWLARLYGIARPPGMNDATLRALLLAMVGAKRGTIACIKAVVDACTGIECTVQDKQIDSSIPSWEIRISPSGSDVWPSYSRGLYAGLDTETFYVKPFKSGLAGDIVDLLGYYGAFINDHAWFPVDLWALAILEKVRPAGTYYVFTGV